MRNNKFQLIWVIALMFSCLHLAYAKDKIQLITDIDYLPALNYEDYRDQLDIYLPKKTQKNPILVHFHGGGLTSGSKEKGSKGYSTAFAELGLCVVAPNYRLAPQYKFPAQIEDAVAAISWVEQNMNQYNCDTSSIYISGHSAGAYLTALLSVDHRYIKKHTNLAGKVKGVIPISPLLDVTKVAEDHVSKVWGDNWQFNKAASVTSYVGPKKLPMMILFGDNDHKGMEEQIQKFSDSMINQGNKVRVIKANNRDHKSIINHIKHEDDKVRLAITHFIGIKR
jgi:acetyl esterase/lipase